MSDRAGQVRPCGGRRRNPPWLTPVEVVVNTLGQRGVDAFDGGEVFGGGAADALGGAEAVEQGFLAALADAGDFIERVLAEIGGGSLCAMGADGPAVGLVAQALEIVERGVVGRQLEGRAAGTVELLASGVAVRALGDGDEVEL